MGHAVIVFAYIVTNIIMFSDEMLMRCTGLINELTIGWRRRLRLQLRLWLCNLTIPGGPSALCIGWLLILRCYHVLDASIGVKHTLWRLKILLVWGMRGLSREISGLSIYRIRGIVTVGEHVEKNKSSLIRCSSARLVSSHRNKSQRSACLW